MIKNQGQGQQLNIKVEIDIIGSFTVSSEECAIILNVKAETIIQMVKLFF